MDSVTVRDLDGANNPNNHHTLDYFTKEEKHIALEQINIWRDQGMVYYQCLTFLQEVSLNELEKLTCDLFQALIRDEKIDQMTNDQETSNKIEVLR